ncbi:sodium-dependent nutrient amino acid transporter 1-like [Malaya genurostris]|uniref:sodium-dependent nutrient amino acid transporter 1-like n=1 Tax=Malaya genurostris TaxID=325434 RepID=UPI0026F400A1|nr:sodium-dependent nutrient amino acid transporter 1-like [Malaya genurostris]
MENNSAKDSGQANGETGTLKNAIITIKTDDSGHQKWGSSIEFLLSCIAISVGFGNVWRFPYTALQNGGGAFVIPYLIVLFVVGRPIYYLEMVMGQFSSRGCVKVFDVCPLMRGVGVGQTITMFIIVGYYAAIQALSLRYFFDSFQSPLPWSECQRGWLNCIDSNFLGRASVINGTPTATPSADFYFRKEIMNLLPNIDNGIGLPDWKLSLCLLACWICIAGILVKGIKSSGKATYFLALFPFVILLLLLIRSCTLTGAIDGIKYFVQPQWEMILKPDVWYAAIGQCFFSLTVGLGAVIVFSSFNNFSSHIYRDATIISILDTATSAVSGVIVFGIVGNLAYITQKPVPEVMKSGPELTFITYPDAIAKMDFAPNFVAVMFFLMFVLLGLGSNVGIVTTILTSIQDRYPHVTVWKTVLIISIAGFCYGLVFVTPGGLIMLDLIDYYGVTFATLTLVILEVITFCWLYGVRRICIDIQFMLGIKTGIFWRVCWGFLTLLMIGAIFIMESIQYEPKDVPVGYNVLGWCLYGFSVLQVVGWAVYAICKRPEKRVLSKLLHASKPTEDWGPESMLLKNDYNVTVRRHKDSLSLRKKNFLERFYQRLSHNVSRTSLSSYGNENSTTGSSTPVRDKWGKDVEFMLSCIAYSVGFGNVWKFPYTALKNGGGAFLIPYLVVLFIVGRPIYYLEMVIGQFASRGVVKVYDLSPAMRGIGVGQSVAMFVVMTYYTPILAITLRYLVASFSAELPWAKCDPSWTNCVDSANVGKVESTNSTTPPKASAELYFTITVMHKNESLYDGVGVPDWKLILCLTFSWLCVATILIKGIKSSGKASYFLAIFPYVIIIILLVHACTLKGSFDGILYFLTPQWDQLLNVTVWYEAVTQCFFSLSVCFGGIIAYSSFNNFTNDVYKVAMIISWLDTLTSIIAGCIVFGVIGNLAFVTEQDDIQKVVQSGAGLTFMTYPNAIAKFELLPQLFSALFFLMLFVVGLGSNLGVTTSIVTAIRDQCPWLKNWQIVSVVSVVGFSFGLIYLTPGGLDLLDILDYYGAKYVTLTLAVCELVTLAWIYGVDRLCRDIKFMLRRRTSWFWKICWGIVTPLVTMLILLLSFFEYEAFSVPSGYNVLGWGIYILAILQLPGWALYAAWRLKTKSSLSLFDSLKKSFRPLPEWGPELKPIRIRYLEEEARYKATVPQDQTVLDSIKRKLFS